MFQMVNNQDDRLERIGAKLFGDVKEKDLKHEKAKKVVETAKELEGLITRPVFIERMGYTYSGGKHLFDINTMKGVSESFLDLLLKQIETVKQKKDDFFPKWQSTLFEIERLFFKHNKKTHLHSGSFNTSQSISRLSQKLPEQLAEYNDELYVGKDAGGWFVDSKENYIQEYDVLTQKTNKEEAIMDKKEHYINEIIDRHREMMTIMSGKEISGFLGYNSGYFNYTLLSRCKKEFLELLLKQFNDLHKNIEVTPERSACYVIERQRHKAKKISYVIDMKEIKHKTEGFMKRVSEEMEKYNKNLVVYEKDGYWHYSEKDYFENNIKTGNSAPAENSRMDSEISSRTFKEQYEIEENKIAELISEKEKVLAEYDKKIAHYKERQNIILELSRR